MVSNIKTENNSNSYTLVFGLTADPIHKGHEQVIHNSYTFAKQNGFNIIEFILVPNYLPNLIANKKQPRTAFKHRFAMCKLSADELNNKFNYQVHVSDIEKVLFEENGQKSYSFDTLQALNKPSQLFVLSADHFAGRWPKFRKWYRWQDLVKNHGLLIHQRPRHKINSTFVNRLRMCNENVFKVSDLPQVNISSTNLRKMMKGNRNISENYISKEVMEFIKQQHLYL